MSQQPVLIDGEWRPAAASGEFQAENPVLQQSLPESHPISDWADCDAALTAAARAFRELSRLPVEKLAEFLDDYARRVESQAKDLVATANAETALSVAPRLADVELPRTVNQLKQAAAAARDGSWQRPVIDSKANIRARFEPLGPVCVFGPNNFPFAFNSVAGGDFAAAIAAGCPVIGKANSSHPGTTQQLAKLAHEAATNVGLPAGTVQLIYRTSHADGEKLVADPRLGATAYTGSRAAGLQLKRAADLAGKPIYLELSSINPVLVLPGALAERAEAIAGEFTGSCLMGAGQFCTNPGLVLLLASEATDRFTADVATRFKAAPVGTLLSAGVAKSLSDAIDKLQTAGAKLLVGGTSGGGQGRSYANTLLSVPAVKFLRDPESFQTEAFGNASLFVVAEGAEEAAAVLELLEGNLTGCVYSDTRGSDDALYGQLVPLLRSKVGRLLNDKMPTGVAVSPAMNHGGPYPATGHPGFTAVGIPAAMLRFAALACYDNVRPHRLPAVLQNQNPAKAWRQIDGAWTQGDIG